MNSVHEQCPINDSETVLSLKTGSKLSQVHKAPNLAQPANTGTPRSTRVAVSWAAAALSWSWSPGRAAGPQRRVVAAAWSCRRCPVVPCRGHSGRVAVERRAPSLVVSWLGCVVLQHSLTLFPCPLSQYTLVYCHTIPAAQLLLVTIQLMYCDTIPISLTLSCHNTTRCLAIQFPHQPCSLSHNTPWCIAIQFS